MAKIIFTLGATVWTANCDRALPVGDPAKVGVVLDYSAGGQAYAYDKGIVEQFFDLVFDKLITAKDTELRTFHETIAVGPLNTFIYTDPDGNEHSVRWLDVSYPLKQTNATHHSGTIRLRKEI